MIIGVDCDGVLTDMSSFILTCGELWFKRAPSNPSGYSIVDAFGCTQREEIKFGLRYFFKYCRNWPPREGAVETVSALNDESHVLYEISSRKFVTMRNPLGAYSRFLYKTWLQKNGFHFQGIYFCAESEAAEEKLAYCRDCGAELMVDDRSDVALLLAENGIPVLLYDAPYNQDFEHPNVVRVYNWNDIYNAIQGFSDLLRK